MTVCFAAVFALGLAACSSSSDDPPETMDDDMSMDTPDPDAQRTSVQMAINAANTAVTGLTDDASDSAITAADDAVAAAKKAVMDASALSDNEKAAFNTGIAAIEGALKAKKTSIADARKVAAEKMKTANAKSGKALHKALTMNPLDLLTATDADTINAAGLMVSAAADVLDGDDTVDDVPLPRMKAGASAGSLGGWKGTNYAHTDPGTKVANSAVVYTNQGGATTKVFSSEYGDGNPSATDGTYAADNRRLTLTGGLAANKKKMASKFPTVGEQIYKADAPGGNTVSFSGKYDGASGTYTCTPTASDACKAAHSSSGITLTGGWTFTHGSGAMVSRPDADYLYFGWWLRKDKDGVPTHASAFVGLEGTVTTATTDVSAATFNGGSATYTGKAAGKFALSNPLDATGDAGHFTADAELTAKFGVNAAPNNGGISGMIDNFMANGKSVPWSVKLNRAQWGTTGAFASTAMPANTIDEGTVWSINGNPAPESGKWEGQMYDEKPSGATNDDGSNVPTTVIGKFQSEFGSIGRMVGAFGATK